MLKRSFMSILLVIPLIAVVFGGAFYFQYSQYRADAQAQGGTEMSLLEYANYSIEILQQKRGGGQGSVRSDLLAILPKADEGWSRMAYVPKHGELITGVLDEPGTPSVHTELEIQNDFRAVGNDRQSGIVASYVNGDQIVSVRLSIAGAPSPTSWEDQPVLEPVSGEDSDAVVPGPVYLTVSDVAFTQLPQISRHFVKDLERPAKYRRFSGAIGDRLEIFAFSNAGDTDVKAVLEGIDYTALKKVAEGIGAGVPDLPRPAQSPEQAADGEVVTASVAKDPAPSLTSRISKLFSTKGSDDEVEPPRRMTCKMRKGAKHCYFPEED